MGDHYLGVLLEDIDGKFDAILESISFMATAEQLTRVDERLTRVEATLDAAVKTLTAHSSQIGNHEIRISKLEAY